MSTTIVILESGGFELTGTGTQVVNTSHVAGYLQTNGSDDATVELREDDGSGRLIFKWAGPIATSFWPTAVQSKTVWYSVSGTGVAVYLFSVGSHQDKRN